MRRSNLKRIWGVVAVALTPALQVMAQESICATDPHDSHCGLQGTLHLLYVLAGVLGVALVGIVVVAVVAYRKNENKKLTPDE